MKRGVLKNFTKFTEKYLCHSLFFLSYKFIKKETLVQVLRHGVAGGWERLALAPPRFGTTTKYLKQKISICYYQVVFFQTSKKKEPE